MYETWIYVGALAAFGLAGRELWLHVKVMQLQRDVSWLVKWINGDKDN